MKRIIPIRTILTATATKQASNPLRAYYHSKKTIPTIGSKNLFSAPQKIKED